MGHIAKWSAISVVVGVAVGLAAVAFSSSLQWMVLRVDYLRKTPWVYLLPAVGLAVSGIITSAFAPEAAGHGTDAVIRAYNVKWGKTSLLVVPVKLVASVFTIAFGGSAGREGPTVQMGGGVGYFIGRMLRLKLVDTRRIVICGMAASFGAIFTAPIAGGIFGTEVMYRDDLEYADLFTSFLSSITAYYLHSVILGKTRLLQLDEILRYDFVPTRDIIGFIIIGILVGIVSLIFIKTLYGYEHLSDQLPLPAYMRTAAGGLLTGLTALLAGQLVLGTGMPLLARLTRGHSFSLPFLLLLLAGKIIATALTIGSGGSGGVVAPAMTIGGLSGAAFASAVGHTQPTAIAAVCAVGLLGSAAHIPITAIFLAAEVFSLQLVLPASIVSFIGSWVARGDTLYRESYVSRLHAGKASHHFEQDLR